MRTPGLRTPSWLLEQCARRLRTSWAEVVCGRAEWKSRFELGTSALTGPRLREAWSGLHLDTLDWHDWAADHGVELVPRAVSYTRGVSQEIPAAAIVASIDHAAALLGEEWTSRLTRARTRRERLAVETPDLSDPAAFLRLVDADSDVDFDLICRTAAWFAGPHPSGLTARQVPVEGIGSKWLDEHQRAVRTLAGLAELDLVPGRPARLHLTYLDPAHLSAGGRRHDLVTLGDVDTLAYRPSVVLISENRDTAQLFPALRDGLTIKGNGTGPGAVALMPWVRDAPTLIYWGDLDAAGLEILHGYRVAGVRATSLFMDAAAYVRWQRFGVDHDHRGTPIRVHPARDLPLLTPSERAIYERLCDPAHDGPRRIEQERIPLGEAVAALHALAGH